MITIAVFFTDMFCSPLYIYDRAPCSDRASPRVIQAVSSGKADLQHKKHSCCRCYLPVLTGFTESPLRRAHTFNTTSPNTVRKKHSLGKEFNPTVADCELQGTASSPSSTIIFYFQNRTPSPPRIINPSQTPASTLKTRCEAISALIPNAI